MSLKRKERVRLIDRSVLAINDTGASRERPEAWFRSADHLAHLRTLPCACGCGRGECEAAHIRIGTDGAASVKPSDAFAVPLNPYCHRRQHSMSEPAFWQQVGVQWPAMFAIKNYALNSPCEKTRIAAGRWMESGKVMP